VTPAPVLVEVERGGLVESCHRGLVVVVDGEGGVRAALGDPETTIYPRSTVKPLQAAAMLDAGLDIDGSALALAAASHSGEPFHSDGVRAMLAHAGLTEADLQCPPDLPYGEEARDAYIAAGGCPERILMNCSGKHAAMLRTCVLNRWPLATYLDPAHPLQRHVHTNIGALAGVVPGPVSTDGCGAPLWGAAPEELARTLVRLAETSSGAQVMAAMRSFPEFSGGTTRDVTHLMRGVPGLLAKDGAEAVQVMVVDTAKGRFGIALKVLDGGQRARSVVAAAALASVGVQAAVITEHLRQPVLGGGRHVGWLRPSATLAAM
jgi:L-asparaginase II